MKWYIVAGVLFFIAIGLMVFQFVRDRKYLKKKASEAMSKELWNEIQIERENSMKRREKFEEALHAAEKGKKGDENDFHSTFS